MKTLSSLKKDLEFNKGLFSLLEVLKTIAVSQFKILEQRIRSFDRLPQAIESFLEFIDLTKVKHPFLDPRNKPQAVVAVTSDSGLLGGLNRQVVDAAIMELTKIPGKLVIIGERGKMYAHESRIPFVAFSGIIDEERYGQATQLRDYLLSQALNGAFGYLKVVYPRPVTFTVQRVETVSFLPYQSPRKERPAAAEELENIILESSVGSVIEYIVYLWVRHKLHEIFGLSRLAEFAARFVHLEESNQKLKDMDAKLKLEYFRVRHELIDRNMRELFAARLAFR